MKKDPKIFLRHILESITEIEKYSLNLSKKQFLGNTQVQDAIIRRLEIIGEAAKNIPSLFRNNHPQIPWQKMAGMRDVLIHEYFGIDLDLVWGVVKDEIPKIKKQTFVLLD